MANSRRLRVRHGIAKTSQKVSRAVRSRVSKPPATRRHARNGSDDTVNDRDQSASGSGCMKDGEDDDEVDGNDETPDVNAPFPGRSHHQDSVVSESLPNNGGAQAHTGGNDGDGTGHQIEISTQAQCSEHPLPTDEMRLLQDAFDIYSSEELSDGSPEPSFTLKDDDEDYTSLENSTDDQKGRLEQEDARTMVDRFQTGSEDITTADLDWQDPKTFAFDRDPAATEYHRGIRDPMSLDLGFAGSGHIHRDTTPLVPVSAEETLVDNFDVALSRPLSLSEAGSPSHQKTRTSSNSKCSTGDWPDSDPESDVTEEGIPRMPQIDHPGFYPFTESSRRSSSSNRIPVPPSPIANLTQNRPPKKRFRLASSQVVLTSSFKKAAQFVQRKWARNKSQGWKSGVQTAEHRVKYNMTQTPQEDPEIRDQVNQKVRSSLFQQTYCNNSLPSSPLDQVNDDDFRRNLPMSDRLFSTGEPAFIGLAAMGANFDPDLSFNPGSIRGIGLSDYLEDIEQERRAANQAVDEFLNLEHADHSALMSEQPLNPQGSHQSVLGLTENRANGTTDPCTSRAPTVSEQIVPAEISELCSAETIKKPTHDPSSLPQPSVAEAQLVDDAGCMSNASKIPIATPPESDSDEKSIQEATNGSMPETSKSKKRRLSSISDHSSLSPVQKRQRHLGSSSSEIAV